MGQPPLKQAQPVDPAQLLEGALAGTKPGEQLAQLGVVERR